jgi:hypothetical protein
MVDLLRESESLGTKSLKIFSAAVAPDLFFVAYA